jgi:hypothetical protein
MKLSKILFDNDIIIVGCDAFAIFVVIDPLGPVTFNDFSTKNLDCFNGDRSFTSTLFRRLQIFHRVFGTASLQIQYNTGHAYIHAYIPLSRNNNKKTSHVSKSISSVQDCTKEKEKQRTYGNTKLLMRVSSQLGSLIHLVLLVHVRHLDTCSASPLASCHWRRCLYKVYLCKY